MPKGTAAGILLVEHLWAKKLKEIAMKQNGVVPIRNTNCSPTHPHLFKDVVISFDRSDFSAIIDSFRLQIEIVAIGKAQAQK